MLLPVILLGLGCVLDYGDWVEARNERICALRVDCFGLDADADACAERLADEDEVDCGGAPDRLACVAAARRASCPQFDVAAARDCLDALELQQDDCPVTRIEDWQIPATCADVCEPLGE